MNSLFDWIKSINPTFFDELSGLQLVIGAVIGFILTRYGQWLLTVVYKFYMSKQDIEIREKNMDNREFMFKQFEKIMTRFDSLDESNRKVVSRLDGIDTRLDGIESDVKDINRRWNSTPFAQFFK